MVVRREKKSRKMHGYRNRGWGNIGQHRKSGSRGGRGAAGMHKHKWSWIIKYFRDWFGKKGFIPRKPIKTIEVREINVSQIDSIAYKLVRDGKAVYEDGKIVIDLSKMGINKVVGSGRIGHPVKLLTYSITKKAKEKIEKAGGTIVILKN